MPPTRELYKWEHIKTFVCKLKDFKRIARRADKTDESFSAIIHLAAAVMHSRWNPAGLKQKPPFFNFLG